MADVLKQVFRTRGMAKCGDNRAEIKERNSSNFAESKLRQTRSFHLRLENKTKAARRQVEVIQAVLLLKRVASFCWRIII